MGNVRTFRQSNYAKQLLVRTRLKNSLELLLYEKITYRRDII